MTVRIPRLLLGATAALILTAIPSGWVAAAPAMALPNCLGTPEVKPAQITFACGDGNFSAKNLVWTGWGGTFAAATGIAELNDCTPNCAAGKFHSYRVVLIADGKQTCPGGRPAYQKITYAFVGRSPYRTDTPGAPDPTVPFACKPRA